MNPERTLIHRARRRGAVDEVQDRPRVHTPDLEARIMADLSGLADEVERLPERDRGGGFDPDRSEREPGVFPAFDLEGETTPLGQGSNGLVEGLPIEVHGDQRGPIDESSLDGPCDR